MIETKIKSSWVFSEWQCPDKQKQEVKVLLEIDYERRIWSITPYNREEKFGFIQSNNFVLWDTVTRLINKANAFANIELNGGKHENL
jgi:hypothetical protein